MSLCVVRLQFQCFLECGQSLCGIAHSFPREAEVVVAGRQFGTPLDCLLKEAESLVEFCALERIYPLKGQGFRLRQTRTELTQSSDLGQLLLSRFLLALVTQGDA